MSNFWRSSCTSLAFAAALALPTAAQSHQTDAEIRLVGHVGSVSVADSLIVQSSQGYIVAPVATTSGTLLFANVGNKVRVTYGPLLEKGPSKPQVFELVLADARRVYVEICFNEDGVKSITHKPYSVPKRMGGKVRTLGGQTANAAGVPANDACAGALPIAAGDTAIDTSLATADGTLVGDCVANADAIDIWYVFTAPGDGTLDLSTCNQAAYDTKLAIYDGATCPPTTSLACNDDTGGCAGFTTELSTSVSSGADYLIRVTGFGTSAGTGTLSVGFTPSMGAPAADLCVDATLIDCGGSASTSNADATDDSDNPGGSACSEGLNRVWFKFVASGTGAVIDTEGSGVSDTILYLYDGTCGALAELDCDDDGGTGFLSKITAAGLTDGTTYYVGVSTFSGSPLGDITVNVSCAGAGDPGDLCSDALSVDCGGSTTFDNSFWATDPDDLPFSCELQPSVGEGWLTFVATATSAQITTEGSLASDTIIGVFDGTCGSFVELACDDDGGSGLLSNLCVEGLTKGTTYYIQVASFNDGARGEITVNLECPCPAPPANDDCADAELLAVPSSAVFDNSLATDDSPAAFCGTLLQPPAANVWYLVDGTGNTMTASTDNGGTVVTDTAIGVYCADCLEPVCVTGDDDSGAGLLATASWCSQLGSSYLITVGNFSAFTTPGVVQLDVSDDGAPCGSPAVSCFPQGACCMPDGSCVIATADDCSAAGGTYQGDDTDCVANALADGGFEAGAFSGNWTEFSVLFGTPLCDVGCSGGLFSRTGDWWCWFGGAPGFFEEGAVSQSIVIPSNASSLDFWLDIQTASGNGTDFMEVTIDAIQVFSILENGAAAGYTLYQIPLGAFADDALHTVEFHAVTDISASFSNFMLDDVSIATQATDCPLPTVVLGFCEDDGGAPLVNGEAIDTEFGNIVTITSAGANAGAAIFDSTPSGPNDPSQDDDLLVDKDCLLILQNDAAAGQTAGVFNNPNDDEDGGSLIFDFVSSVEMLSVDLVDIDEGADEAATVVLTDAAGNSRTFTIPAEWTEDLILNGPSGWRTLDLQDTGPQAGFASVATSVDVGAFDITAVVQMAVNLGSSGGVDDVTFNNL